MVHRPNLYYSKISKRKLKKRIYNFLWNRKKYNLLDIELNSPHLEGQTRYFTVLYRRTIKLVYKNKMDSKFIKFHPCSLERSHQALFWLELNLNSDQDLDLSQQKQILRGLSTSHKNLQKQDNEDFFIQLLYAWLDLTNNNIPPPYL